MSAPFFYIECPVVQSGSIHLDQEASHHAVNVLRMKKGAPLIVTDGKGNLFEAKLEDDHKKKAVAEITTQSFIPKPTPETSIAISLLKNASRFEWFLEKATELGIQIIQPLICDRTERVHFRMDRMNGVLVSAMLQSQQAWLPQLKEPVSLNSMQWEEMSDCKIYVAHCENEEKNSLSHLCKSHHAQNKWVLIGPEGDFTSEEIRFSMAKGAIPVSLGENRLRTETAGVTAAVLMKLGGL